MRQGFDNKKYIELQAANIRKRIAQFGGKLYLEFGGKLFDDYHASRVLPGFEPDSKFRMLKSLADDVEIVIAINANHIEKAKMRGDLGITYDEDVLRLIDIFRSRGFHGCSVVLTQHAGQPDADAYRRRLDQLGITCYLHYPIAGYPTASSTSSPTTDTGATTTSSPRARSNRPGRIYRHVNARQRTIGYYNVSKCETRRSHEQYHPRRGDKRDNNEHLHRKS